MPIAIVGLLLLAAGCGSSTPEPIDPLAVEYCATCSEFASCERIVTQTLTVLCTDENRAWYACVNDNDCDVTACDAEWAVREVCMGGTPGDEGP